jgi:uroporphyrinogen decarboxylase
VNDRLLRACRRQPTDRTPIWLMRQAGRYLPEYRALRARYDFLTLCRTPELAAEVTLQPLRRFPFDAAIVFADILLLLDAMGLAVRFAAGDGPLLDRPILVVDDVRRLATVDPADTLSHVLETIRLVCRERPDVPLIGFAGAPFTLACYALEGQGSRDFARAKRFLWDEPQAFDRLMAKLATATRQYLVAQVRAGAKAVQLFDTWAGVLAPADYEAHVLPHVQAIVAGVQAEGAPVILFAQGASTLLELLARSGADVVSVDWRLPLDEAWSRLGDGVAVQGNLDPAALLARPEVVVAKARSVLEAVGGRPGHIFNLGHGLLPTTPVENVALLVETVHTFAPEAH